MSIRNSSIYTIGLEGPSSEQLVCIVFPPRVTSPGLATLLWNNPKNNHLMDYSGPRLQLQMIVTFLLTQVIHGLLKYLGLPMFISQILAGIVLGPMIFKDRQQSLVSISEDSVAVFGTVAGLGYLFFLFLTGVKMDVSLIYKSGRRAVYIGILTVVIPLITCLITVGELSPEKKITIRSFFLASTYSGTSFPVIHCLLSELKIVNTELGRVGLSAALTGDILTLVLAIGSDRWVKSGLVKGRLGVLVDVGLAISFVLGVAFLVRPLMKWMVRHTPEAASIKDTRFHIAVCAFLLSPWLADLFRLLLLYGPFIMGLAVPDGPPLGSTLVEKLDPVINGFFLPLFASTCGMRINWSSFEHISIWEGVQVKGTLVTLVTKFVVCLVLALLSNMPTRDSLALAFIMISKGVVEMGSYSFLHDKNDLSDGLFVHLTIIIIVVASIVPIVVRRLYDPSRRYLCYQKRTIMNTKMKQELRIIGCIHVPSDVDSIVKLLNASSPTRESPIGLDVLHLVKLSGRATPLFIAHQKHKKTVCNGSYSENVVLAFNQFERENWGAISVNTFTAVSPSNLMHQDICNLAMDRLTTFIILPFHRRWYTFDGSIESEDQTVRSMNLEILEKAPCSTAILVDHRRSPKLGSSRGTPSSYNIVVVFLGGKDDREALSLAKRFSQDQSVNLTVIHLRSRIIDDENERILNDEVLSKDIKENRLVTYVEEYVNDGPATSLFLRSFLNEHPHQLIIVGRRYNVQARQTLGLEQWCEFEEIGIVGDLLSSTDFGGSYFLLIVQQQKQMTR